MNLKDQLQKHDFHFKKKFGQNFISDPNLLQKIVDAAEVDETDVVIEIGPGAGTLTYALAQKAKHVIAIEIDTDLKSVIEETMLLQKNFTLILGDALKMDLDALVEKEMGTPCRYKVVANLPYYITTPLLMHLLEECDRIDRIVVMVQKEVADRLEAAPNCKDYGAVTVMVNYYGQIKRCFNVSRQMFTPRPEVDSAVISVAPWQQRPIEVSNPQLLRAVIKAAFGQRRKTLNNSLKQVGYSAEVVGKVLEQCQIDGSRRGETLSLAEFATLSDTFSQTAKEQ